MFDIYLQILAEVENLIAEVLNRDQPDWYIKHVCPACTYVLKNEEALTFKLLYAMDGNDSLKRVVRQEVAEDAEANLPAPSLELSTGLRLPTSGLYLSRSYVDGFKRQTEINHNIYFFFPTFYLLIGRLSMMRTHAQAVGRIWTIRRCQKPGVSMMKPDYSWRHVDTVLHWC